MPKPMPPLLPMWQVLEKAERILNSVRRRHAGGESPPGLTSTGNVRWLAYRIEDAGADCLAAVHEFAERHYHAIRANDEEAANAAFSTGCDVADELEALAGKLWSIYPPPETRPG